MYVLKVQSKLFVTTNQNKATKLLKTITFHILSRILLTTAIVQRMLVIANKMVIANKTLKNLALESQ